MELPKSWLDITVDQFIQLKNINSSDFDTNISYKIEQICILLDISIDDGYWDDKCVDDLNDLCLKLIWMSKEPNTNFKRDINNLKFKEFNTLTVGEWIDLENLFSINYHVKLPEICSILYRQYKYDEWEHLIIEPRNYDENERALSFYNLPITDIIGVISSYLQYKNKFIDAFSNMLNEKDDYKEDILDEEMDEDEKKAASEGKLNQKWAWERLIYEFSGCDSTKFDEVVNLPLIFFFNQLSMKKDLKI